MCIHCDECIVIKFSVKCHAGLPIEAFLPHYQYHTPVIYVPHTHKGNTILDWYGSNLPFIVFQFVTMGSSQPKYSSDSLTPMDIP